MNPVTLYADPSRLALRLPLWGLGIMVLATAVGVAVGSHSSIRLLVEGVLAFGCLRFWALRTRLTLDKLGVGLSTPLSSWHVPWSHIAFVGVTSFLTPTHRGGVGAGVRLHLTDGGSRSIPDIFAMKRHDLARELGRRSAQSASG